MAPVQKNVPNQLQLDKAEKSIFSDAKEVKDEPPDEDENNDVYHDEDFRGWDSQAVKEESEDDRIHLENLKIKNDSHLGTDDDFVEMKVESEASSLNCTTESVCSRDESYSESSTPRLMICESLDSEPLTVNSKSVPTCIVNVRKSSEGINANKDSSLRKHQCSECGKTFPQASKLAHHLKIHSADKPFRCPNCGKYFALQQHLDWHSRIHTEGSYYCCPVCHRKFTEQTNLSRHLLKTHPDEKPYKCFECGKPFVQASALKRHLKVHDSAMALEEIGRVDSMFLIEENNVSVRDDFQINRKVSKLVEDKTSPAKEHKELKCKLIAKDGEENNLPRPYQHDKQVKKSQIRSKHQKKQLTDIGAKLKRIKNFISSEEQKGRPVLGAHVHNGHCETLHDHTLLGKDRSEVLSGKKSISPDKLPLKGNGTNMDSRFHSKGEDLDRGKRNQGRFGKINLTDMLSESFSCRNCGENFRSKASLYNHVMCHIGMKLHDCSMCGKHFSETLSLERHYIYHITGSFPQECLRCGRHFFSYHDLRDHSQTHLSEKKRAPRIVDQFKCNKCRRNFPTFSILEVHIRSRCLEDRRPGRNVGAVKSPSVKNRENSDNHMVVDVDPHLAFPAVEYVSDSSVKEELNSSGPEKFHNSYAITYGGEDHGLSSDEIKCTSLSPNEETNEHSLGLLDCAECGKKVAGIEAMFQHIKEHVAEKTNLKCPVLKCGKLFKDSSDFQAHIRAHAGEKPYSCSQCSKSFYLKENYDKHMNRHDAWGSIATIIGERPASIDSVKIDSPEGLYEKNCVQWQHHSTNQSAHNEFQTSGNHPPPLSVRHSVIVSKSEQLQHPPPLKQMGQAAPTSVITMTPSKSVSDPFSGHTQKERLCASALVQLFRVSDSVNALNVGNAEYRRYPRSGQCEVCLKFCSRLDKHMMVHLGQKPHLCPMCPQAFRQSEHLKRHVRARHEGNHRVFECPLCLKRLTRKDKLKEHMRNCRKIMTPRDSPISDRLFDVIPGPSR